MSFRPTHAPSDWLTISRDPRLTRSGCDCRPWPHESSQAQHLVALGRAALAYGHTSAAMDFWMLAGNWADLLPLAALQADFGTIRRLVANVRPQ